VQRIIAKCDRNCFACPYPDCVNDEMIADDYRAEREIDKNFLFPLSARQRSIAAYQKAYYEANRDEIAAKQKAYREANRDEIAAKQKAYGEANRDEIAAKQKAYYEANRDARNRYMREYRRKKKGKLVCGS